MKLLGDIFWLVVFLILLAILYILSPKAHTHEHP